MNVIWLGSLGTLIGQGGYLHMGRRFQRGAGGNSGELLVLVLSLVAVVAVAILISRYTARRRAPGFFSNSQLFMDLCREHQLDWTDRRLLKQLAVHHELNPCQLFLEPVRFQEVEGDLSRLAPRLSALRAQLFADEDQNEPQD